MTRRRRTCCTRTPWFLRSATIITGVATSLAMLCDAAAAAGPDPDYSLWSRVATTPARQLVGPLVGHVTDTTANIWCYGGPTPAKLALVLGTEDHRDTRTLDATGDAASHHAMRFEIAGLMPSTTYKFAISSVRPHTQTRSFPAWQGSFTTAPSLGKPAKFSVAVSSCFGGQYRREHGRTVEKRGYLSDSWKLLIAEKPALQLILGDNVYADSTNYNHLWDSHTLERLDNKPFAEAIRIIPTYAVWDDHDYGPNDSDGTEPGKADSLKAFKELFANPSYGTDETPGVFSYFQWGDVAFYLLDGRYHRSPDEAPNDNRKRVLGDGQFRWLVDRLKQSTAKFKVLACGSTWMASRGDGWRIYDFARQRLLQAIVDNRISGVVLTSGDVHWCDIQVHAPEVRGMYPLVEVISSGLGSHGEDDKLGFAIIDFDTTKDDPEMVARIIEGDGREVQRRLVRLSQLKLRP